MQKLAWRKTQPYAVESAADVNLVFGGSPYEAKNRVRGVLMCGGERNAEEDDRSDNESLRAGESEHEWV